MTSEQIQALRAADPKRIAACVKACEGISTENLINNVPLKQGLAGLNKRIREAEAQRDELLAEREADKVLIAELKPIAAHAQRGWQEAHEQEALVEQAMTRIDEQAKRIAELEDAEQKLCAANVTLDARAELAERRLTELEARTLTVNLPGRKSASYYVEGEFDNSVLASIYNTCLLECEVKIKNACAAAGITLVVEE